MFTDFAYEAYKKEKNPAKNVREYRAGDQRELRVWEWNIENFAESAQYGRATGHYITVFSRPIWQMNESESRSAVAVVANALSRLLDSKLAHREHQKHKTTILVAGLGNSAFTVDAIGPKTAERVSVNRHLPSDSAFALAAMIPGVPAGTGMETVEHLKGVVDAIAPDAVLVVDALAAGNYARIGSTIQLGNSGLLPGSGVGNAGKSIDEHTLGIPVITIGVPTVVDASALIEDALRRGGISACSAEMEAVLEETRGFFVCPKESDWIADAVSLLLADAIDHLCLGES